MKLGIVGLPNVGKTTLFNALTGSKAETSAYGVAGARPNIGTAKVPDERLDWLAEYYNPKKYTPATIEFVAVPGVRGGKGREGFLLCPIFICFLRVSGGILCSLTPPQSRSTIGLLPAPDGRGAGSAGDFGSTLRPRHAEGDMDMARLDGGGDGMDTRYLAALWGHGDAEELLLQT